jgi:hypothetical protein
MDKEFAEAFKEEIEKEASTYRDREREEKKKKKKHFAFGGKKDNVRSGGSGYGKHGEEMDREFAEAFKEEIELEEAIDPKSMYKRSLEILADENDKTFVSDMSSKGEKSKKLRKIAINRIYNYIFDKVGSSQMSGEWDQFRMTAGKSAGDGKVMPEKQLEAMRAANYKSEWKKAKAFGAKMLPGQLDRVKYYNTLTNPSDKAKQLRHKAILMSYYTLHRYYGQDKTAWHKFIKASENPALKGS